jgi:hypothetical protein
MMSRAKEYEGGEEPVTKKISLWHCSTWVSGHDYGGCGEWFTGDSYVHPPVCPLCGKHALFDSNRTELPYERLHRINKTECAECVHNALALPCFSGKPDKPEMCRVCPCGKCCAKQKEFNKFLYDTIQSGRGREGWNLYLEMTGIKAGPIGGAK